MTLSLPLRIAASGLSNDQDVIRKTPHAWPKATREGDSAALSSGVRERRPGWDSSFARRGQRLRGRLADFFSVAQRDHLPETAAALRQ